MIKYNNNNKKCRKTINKKYRKNGDIWGRLALKKRDNFITNLVYEYANQTLYKRLRRQSKKLQKRMYYKFRAKSRKKKKFFFQINTNTKRRRKKILSARGGLLRLRRQISLFYGGGRIRQKTFRRYGKITTERLKSNKLPTHISSYQKNIFDTFAGFIESRLDVLLLRCNFVDSIYSARLYIMNHKSWVQTKGNSIRYSGFLINIFQPFGLMGHYTKLLRKTLFTRVRKHAILCLPSYLYINFPLLIAFKIENPLTQNLSFPFSENKGAVAVFRKSFQLL